MRDIGYLKNYKKQVSENLVNALKIEESDAAALLELLEREDFIRIEAPRYREKAVEVLTSDRHLIKNELSMTSHKIGNIVLNAHLSWQQVAQAALGIIETGAGINTENHFFTALGVISILLSALETVEFQIAENETAIIMALQKHNKHRSYTINEELCRKEANEILMSYGYDAMDEKIFQDAITRLLAYKCIDMQDGMIKLKERVIIHY